MIFVIFSFKSPLYIFFYDISFNKGVIAQIFRAFLVFHVVTLLGLLVRRWLVMTRYFLPSFMIFYLYGSNSDRQNGFYDQLKIMVVRMLKN